MEDKSLEKIAGEQLRWQKMTLSVAESCTGGLLGHLITNVAGSSEYFLGGVIAYSNTAKRRLLNVDQQTLDNYGAVSEQVARQMAGSVRQLLQSDLGLAITGIAGPGGALPGKPVGLTYIALSWSQGGWCRRYVWDGDREQNKVSSAEAALKMLLEWLGSYRLLA